MISQYVTVLKRRSQCIETAKCAFESDNVVAQNGYAALPVRVTIDCGSHGKEYGRSSHRSKSSGLNSRVDVDSFCNFIHNAIPQSVKNGRFVLRKLDSDQTGFADTLVPMSVRPPEGVIPKFFLPKFKVPKLKVPKMNVPKLRAQEDRSFSPPKVGSSTYFPRLRSSIREESSAERMEKFKKGVQKMLHVVKVLGQIDQYLSERTRILIDKLAKTFAD